MASLRRKLHGSNAQLWGSSTTSTFSSPSSANTFLIEVIAFGEVYAVPVTKTTPATVVLRYVMEAAVSKKDAAEMGNVEATLYYREKALPLDTVMGRLPKRAVLHLHSSLSATSSVVRGQHQSAISTLPPDRQRYSLTTVTMQPVLKGGSGARGGSLSTAGGLSSEGCRSPSAEGSGCPAEPLSVSPSVYDAGMGGLMAATPGSAPMVMLSPMLVPMVPTTVSGGYAAAPGAMGPYYYCRPVGHAGSGIRMLGSQGRVVSASSLSAYRRREDAVEFANSYHFPMDANPPDVNTTAVPGADTLSPLPSLPGTHAADAARLVGAPKSTLYIVVYLRLPRDLAAAHFSATALSADRSVEMEEVGSDEVLPEALLNETLSTVVTNKSQFPQAYSYRRLRVRRDFPVGTLRELCAVELHHPLYVAHKEVTDEGKSFAELEVPANAVFYFKTAPSKEGGLDKKTRALTRERLKEHLEAAAAAAHDETRLSSPAVSPSNIKRARPSLDRSLVSPTTPALLTAELRCEPTDQHRRSNNSATIITSRQHVHECIDVFNEGVVQSRDCCEETVETDMTSKAKQRRASPDQHARESEEQIITSAVAAEQAHHSAELVVQQAGAEAEKAVGVEQQQTDRLRSSSPTQHTAGQPSVHPIAKEQCVEVDAVPETHSEAPAVPVHITRGGAQTSERQVSPDPKPQPLSATAVVIPDSEKAKAKALGDNKKVFRWLWRSSLKSSNADQQPPPPPRGAESRTLSAALSQQRRMHPVNLPGVANAQRKETLSTARMPAVADAAHSVSPSPEPETPKMTANDSPRASLLENVCKKSSATAATDAPLSSRPEKQQSSVKKMVPSETPAPLSPEQRTRSASAASQGRLSRTSSIVSSLKASLQRLTKRKTKDEASKRRAKASYHSKPADGQQAPTAASEEVLSAMQLKSERVSHRRAKLAAATSAAAFADTTTERTISAAASANTKKGQPSASASDRTTTAAAAETVNTAAVLRAKNKLRRSNGATPVSSAPSLSYSERRRLSTDAVPRQPVAFLGSDPAQQQRQLQQAITAVTTRPGASHTAGALGEMSTTLGPAVLSTTRIPSPRDSLSPVSILVSPSLEQRRRNGSADRTSMTETSASASRRSLAGATPGPRAGTPDYSVESTGSLNRLRITIKDPEDPTRFHYGVPVEPDCPVAALREWITAMQQPAAVTGKTPPGLRDVDCYGVFVGDTYLLDEGTLTFGEVTRGRNDAVFSIRRRL
ncbi:hypothetical protein ABL78_2754 [Leptomonas seymouri]|uniref:Uncharacterized protein n=1 Tax=Leptomonas seymouri TaxID=5684 RepID=A0A0N0P7C9_LEPSE|nr:hypothetical protein ABL78_2754 [Leptomonas seymouri]|eukprot:KPI88177.1 hypothetical protein ABL78_2754 [Leptomonas seymouri]